MESWFTRSGKSLIKECHPFSCHELTPSMESHSQFHSTGTTRHFLRHLESLFYNHPASKLSIMVVFHETIRSFLLGDIPRDLARDSLLGVLSSFQALIGRPQGRHPQLLSIGRPWLSGILLNEFRLSRLYLRKWPSLVGYMLIWFTNFGFIDCSGARIAKHLYWHTVFVYCKPVRNETQESMSAYRNPIFVFFISYILFRSRRRETWPGFHISRNGYGQEERMSGGRVGFD